MQTSPYGTVYTTQPMPALSYNKMIEKQDNFDALKDKYYQEIKNSLEGIGIDSSNSGSAGGITLFFNDQWIGIITNKTMSPTDRRFKFQILINNGEMPHPKLENVKEILRSFVEKYSNEGVESRKTSTLVETGIDSKLQKDPYTTRGISNMVREMAGLPKRVGQGKRKTRKHRSRKLKKTRKH